MKRRRRFRLTREGAFFLLTMVLFLYCSIETGFNLFYLLAALELAMFLLTGLFAGANITAVEVTAPSKLHLWPHLPSRSVIPLTLRNRRQWLASFALHFEAHFTPTTSPPAAPLAPSLWQRLWGKKASPPRRSSSFTDLAYLPPSTETTHSLPLTLSRGEYTLSHIEVSSLFPFGILKTFRQIPQKTKIWAYPPIYFCSLEVLLQELLANRQGRKEEEDFQGLREYVPGDPIRNIHWRTSAKHGILLVRKYEAGLPRHLHLAIHLSPSHFEETLSLTGSLIYQLHERQVAFSLHFYTSAEEKVATFVPERSQSSLHQCFVFLAKLQWGKWQSQPPKGLPSGTVVGFGPRQGLPPTHLNFSLAQLRQWTDTHRPISF